VQNVGGTGQTNTSTGNSSNGSGNGTSNTGTSSNENADPGGHHDVVAPPPGGPVNPTASGTARSDDTSVASGSGLALDNSVASGDAVALHGSVASGCSVAIDKSTASGGTCKPAKGHGNESPAGHHAAGEGPALAFTGVEALQMALAGALALALGALLTAFAGFGRREEASA